jgi:hypothetical protein
MNVREVDNRVENGSPQEYKISNRMQGIGKILFAKFTGIWGEKTKKRPFFVKRRRLEPVSAG